jgi:hypothetical protein
MSGCQPHSHKKNLYETMGREEIMKHGKTFITDDD